MTPLRRVAAAAGAILAIAAMLAGCGSGDRPDVPSTRTAASTPSGPNASDRPRDPDPATEFAYWATVDPCAIARLPRSADPSGDDASRLSQRSASTCQATRVGGQVEVEVLQRYDVSELAQGKQIALGDQVGWTFTPAFGDCLVVVPTSTTHALRVTAPGEDCSDATYLARTAVARLTTRPGAFARPTGARPGACGLLARVATPDYAESDGSTCVSHGSGGEVWLGASLAGQGRRSHVTISGHQAAQVRLSAGDRAFVEGRRACAIDWEIGRPQSVATSGSAEHGIVFAASCRAARRLAATLVPASLEPAPAATAPKPLFYARGETLPGAAPSSS